jgi:hypothetical protein
MLAVSLPSYAKLAFVPSYTAEPQLDERRLAFHSHRRRLLGDFVKPSKNGCFRLRLIGQEQDASQPVYDAEGSVEGTINVLAPDGISSVEIKVRSRYCIEYYLYSLLPDRGQACVKRDCGRRKCNINALPQHHALMGSRQHASWFPLSYLSTVLLKTPRHVQS